MHVNLDELEDRVKTQIKNIRKNLKSGKNLINSINIPSDFSYRTRLRNIPQSILDIDDRVESIEKWLDTTIDNFSSAEIRNKNLMKDLIGAIPLSITGRNVIATGGSAVSILSSDDFIDDLKSSVKGAFDYVFTGEWIIDSMEIKKKTAAKVGEKIESEVLWSLNTGAEIKEEITNYVSSKIESGVEFVGAKISDAWDLAYQNIITPSWDFLKTTGASVANAVIGLVKGLGQLIESVLDFIFMLVTGVTSIFTGLMDGVTYLIALGTGESDKWSSVTGSMWKEVMGYVAEDHVGNIFKSFYSNNVVGQWLDENAIDIFKSDGIGTNIMSGIGYVSGIIVLTMATLRNCPSCYWWGNSSIRGNSSWRRNRQGNSRDMGRDERFFLVRSTRNV